MKIKLLGIDLAKNVFQLCALNQANKVLFNRTVRRAQLRSTIAKLEPTTIAMEACSSAHYWGRSFEAIGHKVLLVPAQHVTPFVRGGKSDARDALAICEAAQRPNIHLVPIKTVEQQDIQLLHRLRQRQVQHSTALANQIRSLGREYGVIFPTGIKPLISHLPEVLEDGSNELSPVARHALADQYQCLLDTRQAMGAFLLQIEQLAAQYPAYDDLQILPGIGPMTASAYIAAIGNGRQFKRGRQVGAWLGLAPRQYGTGGELKLGGITKSGDRHLRTLMIHGARAVITRGLKTRPELAQWVQPIIERQGFNKGVVALANKLARISWVIVTTGEPFDMKQAFKPAS
jgi:transposase